MDTSDDDIRQLRRSIAEPAAFRAVFERHHPALRRYRVGVGRGTVRGRWVALRGQGTEGGQAVWRRSRARASFRSTVLTSPGTAR